MRSGVYALTMKRKMVGRKNQKNSQLLFNRSKERHLKNPITVANNQQEKANSIIETYVEGQTSEPEVLYHIAEIYKAVGKTEKVKELKSELVASLYELGPTMAPKIKQL